MPNNRLSTLSCKNSMNARGEEVRRNIVEIDNAKVSKDLLTESLLYESVEKKRSIIKISLVH